MLKQILNYLPDNLFYGILNHAPYPFVWMLAKSLVPEYTQPKRWLGWHFGIAEKNNDWEVFRRLEVWRVWPQRFQARALSIRWYHGLRLMVWPGNDLSRCTYVGGAYEPNEMHFMDRFLQPGMQFLDVGANEGIYSLLAASKTGKSGRVWVIEPSTREFKRLQQNMRLNDLSQVICHQVAISNKAGLGVLKLAENEHAGQNTLGEFVYDIRSAGVEQVTLTTLDELTENGALLRPDLIKIDVEGLELQVLQGAIELLRIARPLVLCEQPVNEGGLLPGLADLWREYNYIMYYFKPDGSLAPGLPAEPSIWNLLAVPAEKTDLIKSDFA